MGGGRMTESSGGVGAAVRRREDDRLLRGRGEFVADIRRPRLADVAFLRSPVAHGRLRALRKPAGAEGAVFALPDLIDVRPIRADSALPGFKSSAQPVLAGEKVRYVGELVAACVAESRAEAEDLADAVELEIEELPAVADMVEARASDAPLLHEPWGDNVFLETLAEGAAELAPLKAEAAAVVTRSLRTARQSLDFVALEG